MPRLKIEFSGADGSKLAGLLETPKAPPVAFVLFAHCFTCGKDVIAASRISRALVARGYAVCRFDFTGLGSSEGDFANANFSSNIDDLLAAADFLRENYQAPSLLIGHSLGGTAVLAAGERINEVKGIVTIGAPADPEHVTKQFACEMDTINKDGKAKVSLAGREFTIKKQFLEDIAEHQLEAKIARLKSALLIFHSPLDETVAIKEAEKIYLAAKHPKSFITLDKADHLLTKAEDAAYVSETIASWASRYVAAAEPIAIEKSSIPKGQVMVKEKNKKFTREVSTQSHQWLADEPVTVGGNALGPDPYDHLLAALGTCTSMTIRMYANRKKLPLNSVDVIVSHSREHAQDCQTSDGESCQIEVLHKQIKLDGPLQPDQKQRLMEIAERCPVNRTLKSELKITAELLE